MYNVTLRRVCESLHGEAVSISTGVCVRARACGYLAVWACACTYGHVAFLIQHVTHMRYIVMSFVAPWCTPNFSTLSHKRCNFQKKFIEHKTCFDFLYNLFKTFPILGRIYQDIFKNVETSSCKVPVILVWL
jgi:hypothetical protein